MKSFVLTPAAGKRLIAKAVVVHPAVRKSLGEGTVVIIAGTIGAALQAGAYPCTA